MNAHTSILRPRPSRGALAAPADGARRSLLQSCTASRLRRHPRAAGDPNRSSGAGWQAVEWSPAQPAIVFGGGGGGQGGADAGGIRRADVADAASSPTAPTLPPPPPPPVLLRLAVYTKPGCPLCDNLADRAQAVLDRAAFLPGGGLVGRAGLDVRRAVERRDVSLPGREAWAARYAGEVPVLVMLRRRAAEGDDEEKEEEEEVPIARPPPRVTADKLERHLAAAAAEEIARRRETERGGL